MDEQERTSELLAFFKALADGTRLKIVGLLAQERYSVEQLAAILGLKPSTVSHHLHKLGEAGLVEGKSESYYNVYALRLDDLRQMAERLLRRETWPAAAADLDANAYDSKVIRDFSRRDGSLKEIPAQQKKLEAILRHLVKAFEPDRHYTEKQVNQTLARYHPDTASLRRYLVEHRLLQRAGGKYWRVENTPGK